MPAHRKVDMTELQKLRNEGLGVRAIAARLGVNKGTISKNIPKLKAIEMQGQSQRAIEMVNQSDLAPQAKLKKIMEVVEGELDKILIELEGMKRRDKSALRELLLKHSAELRKQIELLLEVSVIVYRIQEIEQFKKIVLEELEKESPELRDRVLNRLKERRERKL